MDFLLVVTWIVGLFCLVYLFACLTLRMGGWLVELLLFD